MSDRFNYLIVALEKDMRDDDANELIKAIGMFRNVLSVSPNIVNAEAWLAEERAREDLGRKIIRIIYPKE